MRSSQPQMYRLQSRTALPLRRRDHLTPSNGSRRKTKPPAGLGRGLFSFTRGVAQAEIAEQCLLNDVGCGNTGSTSACAEMRNGQGRQSASETDGVKGGRAHGT